MVTYLSGQVLEEGIPVAHLLQGETDKFKSCYVLSCIIYNK